MTLERRHGIKKPKTIEHLHGIEPLLFVLHLINLPKGLHLQILVLEVCRSAEMVLLCMMKIGNVFYI